MELEDIRRTPNALTRHYSHFKVSERLLLTGHSHQAWPDCGLEAQRQAWLDAAELVDAKWARAFDKAERVRKGFSRLLDDESGHIALGANTHELVVRFLSALPLGKRPRLITTDSEFHTLRRQLDRLVQSGQIELIKLSAHPTDQCSERIAVAVDDRTAAVLVSAVFYNSGQILPNLAAISEACRRHGAYLLLDVYHALNVLPFSLKEHQLDDAFIVGGGYKYCQLGEGNCFLRFPKDCTLQPVITGWYSEYGALQSAHKSGEVAYGPGPALFAGSTYDPTSHYRAARVFDFFEEEGLEPDFLRQISQHQIGLLAGAFDGLDLDPELITRDREIDLSHIAGFLSLRSSRAEALSRALARRGVVTDARGDRLRFGPAPYLSDAQLVEGMRTLGRL